MNDYLYCCKYTLSQPSQANIIMITRNS